MSILGQDYSVKVAKINILENVVDSKGCITSLMLILKIYKFFSLHFWDLQH